MRLPCTVPKALVRGPPSRLRPQAPGRARRPVFNAKTRSRGDAGRFFPKPDQEDQSVLLRASASLRLRVENRPPARGI